MYKENSKGEWYINDHYSVEKGSYLFILLGFLLLLGGIGGTLMPIIMDFVPNENEKIRIQQIARKIDRTIDSDPFLRNNVDKRELVKRFTKDPKYKYCIRAMIDSTYGLGRSITLVTNLSLVDKPKSLANAFTETRLLTQLYRIPGEERASLIRPSINRKLKSWYDKLKDDFFPLYEHYEMALINMGCSKGVMLNHPHIIDEVFDIYSHVVQTALLNLILEHPKDYLLHYTEGLPCVWPAFLLADAREKGEELKSRLEEVYESTHPLVIRKIIEHGNLISENDPFNEYFYPSLTGDVNYLTLLNKFLQDSVEVRQLSHPHTSQVAFNPSKDKYAKLYFLDSLKQRDHIR